MDILNNRKKGIFFLSIVTSFSLLVSAKLLSQTIDTAIISKQISSIKEINDPVEVFNKAATVFNASNKINYKIGMLNALALQAKAKFATAEVEQSKKYYDILLSEAGKINDKQFGIEALVGLGNVAALNQGQKPAFEIYNKALDIAKIINDSMLIANIYSSIAGIMINTKNANEATKYLNIANAIYRQQNKISKIALNDIVISTAYVKQGNYIDGKLYSFKALQFFESNKGYLTLVEPYINLGICYDYTNKKDSALYYYTKALQIIKLRPYKILEMDVCNNIAILYDDWHIADSAKKYYEMALNLATSFKNYEMISLIADNLAEFYAEQMNNPKLAYDYQKLSAEAKDSLVGIQKNREFNELFVKFETKEVEAQNLILKKENELHKLKLQQKKILISGLLLFIVALAIVIVLWLKHNKIKTKQEIELLEQKQLRSQMNPHFLFNSLNSIQHYILNSDVVTANQYLSEYATLIRRVLNITSQKSISLKDEIEYLENYLSLEKLRFDDCFTYSIICKNDINKSSIFIPPMMIQPFVENAVYHGLRHLNQQQGKLLITFSQTTKHLICTIDDNGIGIDASQKAKENLGTKYESQAISITQKRLELINKIKGSNGSLTIEDKQQINQQQGVTGTLITLKFSL